MHTNLGKELYHFYNMMIIIRENVELCGNTIEMMHLQIMLALLMILLVIVLRLTLHEKQQLKQIIVQKKFDVMVSLKYFINFWRTVEMPLINCEINLILTWSVDGIFSDTVNQETKFAITDAKLYVLVVTLSTKGNAKLL